MITGGVALVMIVWVGATLAGLAAGYRPVVIQTGSMGDAAPPGSLVVAAPRSADTIQVGDILVMRRPGSAPVTHRVIEIRQESDTTFAITKGDANQAADPAPYALTDHELVARWVAPGAGSALHTLRDPRLLMATFGVLLLVVTVLALRRIWADHRRSDDAPPPPRVAAPRPPPPAWAPPVPRNGVPSPGESPDSDVILDHGNPTVMDQQDPSPGSDADLQIVGAP